MASERAMMRRYIVDSVTYWAREYHIDGFRFDLMGLIDTDTMNAVRASLDALPGGKDLIMYGEPWAAGPSSTLPGT
ncbi:pullulanase, partial [Bifidobacterium breve]